MNLALDQKQLEKAVRLLEFLLKLSSLRSRLVRDLEDYERVLWISDIPHEKGCFTQAWGRDEDFDSDIWIEVRNQREPVMPSVPDACKDWVDRPNLQNKNDLPTLLPEVTRQVKNPAWLDGSDRPEFVIRCESLQGYPAVQRTWDRYVELDWLPWAEKHNLWERIHTVYASLFAIHQERLRLGEEYELVLGLGLLTWQSPTGQRVRRHLLVANASLEFEPHLGKFTIRPDPGGALLRPELDMLDIEEQPPGAEAAAQRTLADADDDPWQKERIEGVLRALAHSISPHGEYREGLEPQRVQASGKPLVEYAPALILRKRSIRGLTDTLKQIKAQIQKGGQIPAKFGDLAETSQSVHDEIPTDPGVATAKSDTAIYFPKPSNEEQRRIVGKIETASAVLVQGPPGTGKSHTIANLICHLLATGRRVLITAKTPRALQVLEDLLPEELRPLCINLLGDGPGERRALETSVNGMLYRSAFHNNEQSKVELANCENKLKQLREENAEVTRRLRAIRESETHPQVIADGTYRGTAARIAQAVKQDAGKFNWFTDRVSMSTSCPISGNDLHHLVGTFRRLSPDKRSELKLVWPDGLPAPDEFASLVAAERSASEQEESAARGTDSSLAESLAEVTHKSINALLETLASFQSECHKLLATPEAWMQAATRDILAGHSTRWRVLLQSTREIIANLEPFVARTDATDVKIPESVKLNVLIDDTWKLMAHIESGGSLGWWLFRPRPVKEAEYVIRSVRVNGRKCADLPQLKLLAEVLNTSSQLEKAWELWRVHCPSCGGTSSRQLRELIVFCDMLERVLSLEETIQLCQSALRQCGNVPEPVWSDDSQIRRLMGACRLVLLRNERRLASGRMQQIETSLLVVYANYKAHPVTGEVRDAIQGRNVESYARGWERIGELNAERASLRIAEAFLDTLRGITPEFADGLVETYEDGCWDWRIPRIRDAWHWMQARTWLEDYVRTEDASSLARRAKQIEDEINECTAVIASLRAWSYCFSRLQEKHRRHMEAWRQEIKLLGKGTGKHAPRHRREAQKHLNECREAVPAWVMPLHRVWDTVSPAPGMFDLIIVDEASQCGFEALPLFYLGTKLLIVGDDKQISPDAVGLPRDAVHRLIEEFLHDFRFKSSFDVELSLFDHGKLRFGTSRITLQEHFRCMPEIIQFSNDLCYFDTRLIPLRQYGLDRLKPLEHVFLKNGYREGSESQAVNPPEAEAIAAKVVELCRDPRYDGKTMGVVVLQGDAQAHLIENKLLGPLGAEEMQKRRIVCGNPYSFQGDERDIMFMSMVAAPNERIGPLTKAGDERRFNVAASRARDQMWLFHSVSREDLSTSCLRRKLLEFFEEQKSKEICGLDLNELERRAEEDDRAIIKPPKPFDSWFEVDVALEISRKGFRVLPQFEVAGKRIDLMIKGSRSNLAVECDGDTWHGADRYEEDSQRQRMLERCRLEFFRVRASEFYHDRERTLRGLWRSLEQKGIRSELAGGALDSGLPHVASRGLEPVGSLASTSRGDSMEAHDLLKVHVGSTVTYVDEDDGSEHQAMITSGSSSPELGVINANTPIARALLGAQVGQLVVAHLPMGSVRLRVLQITRAPTLP